MSRKSYFRPAFPVDLLPGLKQDATEPQWFDIYQKYYVDPEQDAISPLGIRNRDLPLDPRFPLIEVNLRKPAVESARFSSWRELTLYIIEETTSPSKTLEDKMLVIFSLGIWSELFRFIDNDDATLQEVSILIDNSTSSATIIADYFRPILRLSEYTLKKGFEVGLLNGHFQFINFMFNKFYQHYLANYNYNVLLIKAGYLPRLELISYGNGDPAGNVDMELLETIRYNRFDSFVFLLNLDNIDMLFLYEDKVLISLIQYRRRPFFQYLADQGYFTYTPDNMEDNSSSLDKHFKYDVFDQAIIECYSVNAKDMIEFILELVTPEIKTKLLLDTKKYFDRHPLKAALYGYS